MSNHRLLIVDDDINVLAALKRLLIEEDYHALTAQSGEEGLKLLEKECVDLIISDHKMTGMNGLDFLGKTVENHPDTIRIILTGKAEFHDVISAINNGYIYKFILKPWNDEDLKITVKRALEYRKFKTRDQLIKEIEHLRALIRNLKKLENRRKKMDEDMINQLRCFEANMDRINKLYKNEE